MAKHNWIDQVSIDPANQELEATEEQLYLSAKSGSLFEPEMTQEEWRQFCDAAALEEEERKGGVSRKASCLTKKQTELLQAGAQSVKNPGVRKVLKRREELIKQLRPQCVDPQDEEFEKEMLEDLGLTEDEFKSLDKSLGPLQDWDELEKLNDR